MLNTVNIINKENIICLLYKLYYKISLKYEQLFLKISYLVYKKNNLKRRMCKPQMNLWFYALNFMTKIIIALPQNGEIEGAKKLCEITNKINSAIDIKQGHFTIDAKSLLGILSINLQEPMEILLYEDLFAPDIKKQLEKENIFAAIY